jgi:hypothetical protein
MVGISHHFLPISSLLQNSWARQLSRPPPAPGEEFPFARNCAQKNIQKILAISPENIALFSESDAASHKCHENS